MKTFYLRRKLLFAPLFLLAIAVVSWLTMQLWNCIIPAIFSLPVISFWQAMGLLVLARLLFSSGRMFGGCHSKPWRYALREKMANMSPEERETFFKNMHYHRHYCCNPNADEREVKSDTDK